MVACGVSRGCSFGDASLRKGSGALQEAAAIANGAPKWEDDASVAACRGCAHPHASVALGSARRQPCARRGALLQPLRAVQALLSPCGGVLAVACDCGRRVQVQRQVFACRAHRHLTHGHLAHGHLTHGHIFIYNVCRCNGKFSLVLRKHHCRHCGLIFCAQCCRSMCMPARTRAGARTHAAAVPLHHPRRHWPQALMRSVPAPSTRNTKL